MLKLLSSQFNVQVSEMPIHTMKIVFATAQQAMKDQLFLMPFKFQATIVVSGWFVWYCNFIEEFLKLFEISALIRCDQCFYSIGAGRK